MNPTENIDINNIDFEDNPAFTYPEDHYFDSQDAYIDVEESYLIANIRAENTKSSNTNAGNGSGSSSFWNLKKVLIAVIVIFALGCFSKFAIILIALLSAIF